MKFLKAMRLYGLITLFLLCGRANGQEMVSVPVEVAVYPEMIVYNGKVVTMDDHSFGLNTPVGTIAQAMAVRGGKIMAIGTNAQIQRLAGPQTERIDVKGRMVMPGIVDTHTHIHNHALSSWLSKNPEAVEATSHSYRVSARTEDELVEALTAAVQEHVRSNPPGKWGFISVGSRGGGQGAPQVSGMLFLAQQKFTKQMLDPLSPQHPIMLSSHPSYVINQAGIDMVGKLFGNGTMSLEAAGIDETGRVRSTATQYGRGILVDLYFNSRVPLLADITEDGLLKNAAAGITTYVSHIMGQRFLDAFNLLVRQDRMPIRFGYNHWFGFAFGYADSEIFYRRVGDMDGMGTDYFWNNGVGLGAIDSGPPRFCSTMEAPRAQKELEWCQNGPGTREYATTKTAIMNYQRVQVGHAFADKGVDYFMDAVEAAMQENPAITLEYIRSRRLSADHCGFFPRKEQLPRLKKLGIIISCGANVLDRSNPWIGPGKYAPKYVNQIAPIRSAIEGGVMVTLETEVGVVGARTEGVNPTSYFGHAVPFLTRTNARGAVVAPGEAIDRNTLLKMMTNWAALFVMKEDVLGSLEPGKWADFLVLSNDYFAGPPEALYDVYPLMTVVGGKVRTLREEFANELGGSPVGSQLVWNTAPGNTP